MLPTIREPTAQPAPFSLLFFSQPPSESPSAARTIAVVTLAHAFVIAGLALSAWLYRHNDLPLGSVVSPPVLLDADFTSLSLNLDRPQPATSPAGNTTRPTYRRSARPPARHVPVTRDTRLLGTPVAPRLPEPPAVVSRDIPKPGTSVMAAPFANLPAPPAVDAVAPRGVDAPAASGNGNGNGGTDDVADMTLDELAREPRFTPFTQAPELMNRAEVRAFLQTRYPPALSARGLGGRAVLWLLIDQVGDIRKALLLRTSGNARLDDAALEAIDRMEFRPAINKGKKVPVWVQLPISFQPNW